MVGFGMNRIYLRAVHAKMKEDRDISAFCFEIMKLKKP